MTEAVHSRTQRSSHQTFSEGYSQSPTTASKFYSLFDEVDSEFIAEQFEIGKHTAKHEDVDFEQEL